jgi:hypothetical protein
MRIRQERNTTTPIKGSINSMSTVLVTRKKIMQFDVIFPDAYAIDTVS